MIEIPDVTILDNDQVVAGFDVIFLCLLARVAEDVLPSLPVHAGHAIHSAKVDMPLARQPGRSRGLHRCDDPVLPARARHQGYLELQLGFDD